MPEPDFDELARRLTDQANTITPLTKGMIYYDIKDALRQVWNARGAVDIERWILMNVDERVVPEDEGHGDALKYNLIHLLRDGPGYRRFEYAADQEAEIASWVKPE